MKLLKKKKKKKIEKFIEEPDFVELSTQAKHLRMRILHGHYLNDSPPAILLLVFEFLFS